MGRERGPERPRESWLLARRYPDVEAALTAYEAARDLLVEGDLDASVLRITVAGVNFVTVLGEVPLGPDANEHLNRALGEGIEAQLPAPVIGQLIRRRRAFRRTGIGFMERRSGL
jgi:hypothetical protein